MAGMVGAPFTGRILKPFSQLGTLTVLPADDPNKLRLGWVIYEEIGMVVINDYAVSRATITDATDRR